MVEFYWKRLFCKDFNKLKCKYSEFQKSIAYLAIKDESIFASIGLAKGKKFRLRWFGEDMVDFQVNFWEKLVAGNNS
jgi:hypothetical protein